MKAISTRIIVLLAGLALTVSGIGSAEAVAIADIPGLTAVRA